MRHALSLHGASCFTLGHKSKTDTLSMSMLLNSYVGIPVFIHQRLVSVT